MAPQSPASTTLPSEREFVSPADFVALSGLSLATVRRYVADGRLPSAQPGGRRCRVLIPVSALSGFVRTRPTIAPQPQPKSPTTSIASRHIPKKTLPGPPPRWRSKIEPED